MQRRRRGVSTSGTNAEARRYPFAHHTSLFNPATGVSGIITVWQHQLASAVMEPAWIHASTCRMPTGWYGIAGVDPEDASIGSAAWANTSWMEIWRMKSMQDVRSADWPTGYFARNTKRPYDPNKPEPTGEIVLSQSAAHEPPL